MSAERPVLIVDDDAALRETLVDQLAVDGEFAATEAASVHEAEAKLSAKDARFDAVILDVGLPDGDGRDLCAKLRKQGQRMPIIMLTGSDGETDVVRGLDSGANDYIAKPFRLTVCWLACVRNCASSKTARMRCSPSDPILSARRQNCCRTRQEPPHPPDGKGGGDPEVPISGRNARRLLGRCC